MTIEQRIAALDDKATPQAYDNLIYLEELSDCDYILYPYLNRFIFMLGDKRYTMRVRGFRLACRQARWDTQNILDKSADKLTYVMLNEEKPTALRQYISALRQLIIYKEALKPCVKSAILKLNIRKYTHSMQGVLQKDIEEILKML